jgi:hypothetical protein
MLTRTEETAAAVAEMDGMLIDEGIDLGDHFSDDETGALEICLEVETSWNALHADMADIEHRAIVNEDAAAGDEGKKTWWRKLVEFFQRAWAAISSWFRRAWDWIDRRYLNGKRWWQDNAARITVQKTEYKTYMAVWTGHPDGVRHVIDSYAKQIRSANSTNVLRDAEHDVGTTSHLFGKMMGNSSPVNATITRASVQNNFDGVGRVMEAFKDFHGEEAAMLRDAIRACKARLAISAMESFRNGYRTDEQAEAERNLRGRMNAAKLKIVLYKKVDAAAIRSCNTIISDSFGAARKMLRESLAPAKERVSSRSAGPQAPPLQLRHARNQ